MGIEERAAERFKRLAAIGAERALARKRAMIDLFGPGGTEMNQAQQDELYGRMASDETGQMMAAAIQRAQRPYRSLRGTGGIPRAFVEWDAREWRKRNDRVLKQQAEEQPTEEGEET